MSERDWADELVLKSWAGHLGGHQAQWLSEHAAALREHHARGLREGAAAERQRCAAVCEARMSEWWRRSVEEANRERADALEDRAEGARVCRDAILTDPGAGDRDADGGTMLHCRTCDTLLPVDDEDTPNHAFDGHDVVPHIQFCGPAEKEPVDTRTVEQVEAARRTPGGCCDQHADQHACDCLERAKASEAAPSHGPPATADPGRRLYEGGHVQPDPNPPVCGTCALWAKKGKGSVGFCRVVRDDDVHDGGHAADLQYTTADHACDIGAWRARENPAGG